MPMFRRKPVTVEARQWTGDGFEEFESWGQGAIGLHPADMQCLVVGNSFVAPGSWVLRFENGTFAVRANRSFQGLYEPADQPEGAE